MPELKILEELEMIDVASTEQSGDNQRPNISIDNPLHIIEAEHARQLVLLTTLGKTIEADDTAEMTRLASTLLDFFKHELAAHMELEEKALFPLLKEKCHPSDDLNMILGQLSYEHSLDRDLVEFLVADLEKIAHGHHSAIPSRFYINAQAFIETQRRHINWENQIVLPLARKRLNKDDLQQLKRQMKSNN